MGPKPQTGRKQQGSSTSNFAKATLTHNRLKPNTNYCIADVYDTPRKRNKKQTMTEEEELSYGSKKLREFDEKRRKIGNRPQLAISSSDDSESDSDSQEDHEAVEQVARELADTPTSPYKKKKKGSRTPIVEQEEDEDDANAGSSSKVAKTANELAAKLNTGQKSLENDEETNAGTETGGKKTTKKGQKGFGTKNQYFYFVDASRVSLITY